MAFILFIFCQFNIDVINCFDYSGLNDAFVDETKHSWDYLNNRRHGPYSIRIFSKKEKNSQKIDKKLSIVCCAEKQQFYDLKRGTK